MAFIPGAVGGVAATSFIGGTTVAATSEDPTAQGLAAGAAAAGGLAGAGLAAHQVATKTEAGRNFVDRVSSLGSSKAGGQPTSPLLTEHSGLGSVHRGNVADVEDQSVLERRRLDEMTNAIKNSRTDAASSSAGHHAPPIDDPNDPGAADDPFKSSASVDPAGHDAPRPYTPAQHSEPRIRVGKFA